jgi:GR25 family glycosyltransferase involved in LPS biosynthesis
MIIYQLSLHGTACYDARGKTWEQVQSETGCKPNAEWLDPIHDRPLLIGEFGCAVSHLRAWEKVVDSGVGGIILEEDAVFDSINTTDVNRLLTDHDSVWLGYRWNDMGYWYNCHAYAITPTTAKLLIEDFEHQIIPTDEWVPLRLKDKNNYFYQKEVVTQIPRSTRPSTIEDTQMLTKPFQNMHVVTVGTEDSKCWALNQSLIAQKATVKNVGLDKEAFNMDSFGGMPKISYVRSYLNDLPDTDIVLFMDGYDTFLADDLSTIKERFLGFNVDILFSAEEDCWPLGDDNFFKSRWKDEGTPYKYLNSGVYIGRVGALKYFFDLEVNAKDNGDDQLFCQHRFLHVNSQPIPTRDFLVALDYEAYIFQSHDKSIRVVNGQLWNSRTNCCGCVYHGNGGEDAKSFFVEVAGEFGYHETIKPFQPALLETKYEEVAQDVLVMPFLSESECKALIQKSENLGNWGQMEGDKFPAQEIRLKDLGLWDDYEAKWRDNLFKVCEEHWKPVEYMGLRDAFTMRYAMDTQTSLGLHTDAALITGSVKLNDNYEGATLYFPRQSFNNFDVPVGSCILFPSQVTHGHYVDELQSGIKYSLTMWTSRYVGDVN